MYTTADQKTQAIAALNMLVLVCPVFFLCRLVEDLELGRVLLFPIDDRQSRLDGQDHVSCVSESRGVKTSAHRLHYS